MRKENKKAWRSRQLHTPESFPFRPWLKDHGSLTARLQGLGDFSVELLRQQLKTPNPDEARRLDLMPWHLARIREVTLLCDKQPLVFAHTVMPCPPRGPMARWLARLGNRSLGELLFTHPGFLRGPLETRRIDARHPLYQPSVVALKLADKPPAALWARRSCFSFGKQCVLVTEVFSPEIARFTP